MIRYKTEEEIEILREGGKINDQIIREVAKKVKPGVKTSELNSYAEKLIDEAGVSAAFLGYTPEGVKKPYPASLCVSVNEEVVHGIPSEDHVLEEGDIVTLDLGITHRSLITDHAVTIPVGKIDEESKLLIQATAEAINNGIAALKIGGHIGDFGAEVMKVAQKYNQKYNLISIVEDLSGHGVGYGVHEEPFVPNAAKRGEGPEIREGLVIAVEPMFALGKGAVKCLKDGYTYVTRDKSRAAHFEHTLAFTKKGLPDGKAGVEILTKI